MHFKYDICKQSYWVAYWKIVTKAGDKLLSVLQYQQSSNLLKEQEMSSAILVAFNKLALEQLSHCKELLYEVCLPLV